MELVNLTALGADDMALITVAVDAATKVVDRWQVGAKVTGATKLITNNYKVLHLYLLRKKLRHVISHEPPELGRLIIGSYVYPSLNALTNYELVGG